MSRTAVRFIPFFIIFQAASAAAERPLVDAGKPFGLLPLVDQVDCGNPEDPHPFIEEPEGASQVERILGETCRVLPNRGDSKYFAYRIGKDRDLKAGGAYVLSVTFPEDRPRTLFILNRGAEVSRGVATGAALGDVLYTYTNNNVESLRIPLSGAYRTWKMLFFLHDRFPGLKQPRGEGPRPEIPGDGFWVIITQSSAVNAPRSAGGAVARIRLFEVLDFRKHVLQLRRPPEGLPRRHLFFREEMSDGVVASRDVNQRGLENETDWFEYQARLMQFLGMDTFSKDLLEFGHNQGWDCTDGGGNNWYWQSKTPERWWKILEMLGKYDFSVLPYYEYAGGMGAKGLGKEKRCRPLGDNSAYTHITWSEIANADITDPATLNDAKKLLHATILRHKDKVNFLGAWFRTRPSHIPVSFSDRCLDLFEKEGNGGKRITREILKNDANLLDAYLQWWFGKRKEFLLALRDDLREQIGPEAMVIFTPCGSEPGPSLLGWERRIVTDDLEAWKSILAKPEHKKALAVRYDEVIEKDGHLQAALSPPVTWGRWEWQHSLPPPDPARYKDTDGIFMTYPFNRAYTVSSPRAFDAFRAKSGLAIIRHDPLNEHSMNEKLGYFVSDVERAGPFCMLGEARAVAYGDPYWIGYLAAASFNRGFPEEVRAFNAAFMSLPALPSVVLKNAASHPEVVVRSIRTEHHGTYLAAVNVGFERGKDVIIKLPDPGHVTDAAMGKSVPSRDGTITLSLDPCELRALQIIPP